MTREENDAMSTPQKHHFAARMGHWSARHRKKAIFGWLAFVIVAFALGTFVLKQQMIVFETSGPGESGRADTILYEDFKQPAGESVLVQNSELRATHPEFKAAVQDVITRVGAVAAIAKVESPFDEENTGQISDDKHSVLVELEIAGESDKATDKIDPVVDRVKEVQSAHPDFYIGSVGTSTGKDVQEAFFEDLQKAGLLSLPLTLIILIVAFGALVAAGIPLLLGLTAVLATMGLITVWSQFLTDGGGRGRARSADRACRGSRLLDVLLEARTRRACRRSQRGSCARGGRGDLGPVGAHLGADRAGRDVRDVLDRRCDVRGLRCRDHDRRRSRHAGLAHRAACRALQAR
jgi:MMPL family